jgi:class 3 adenylate cyclase
MDVDVRYARNGEVSIAYQVLGEGNDLVYVPEFMSNVVYDWEVPYLRAFFERLARSFRLIRFDKRGCGLSDMGSRFAALETRTEDMRAVLDAVESRAAVVLTGFEGTGMAAMYAAAYPERVRALVLFQPPPPKIQLDSAQVAMLDDLRERWGTREHGEDLLRTIAPTLYGNEDYRRTFVNRLRLGASPSVAYAINRSRVETDLSDVLPAIRAPTLVLYRAVRFWDNDDEDPVEGALDVASRIPNARAQQVSGTDWYGMYLSPELVDEIERFVEGRAAPRVPDSVLATVMFTDLVRSTERSAALGDRAWRDLLARHHSLVRRELARFHGVERDTAGDGFFATFDGPARAVRCGRTIIDAVAALDLEVRVGIHVGECEQHEQKVAGLAVSIGARVAALARPGEVLVSGTVKDLTAGTGLTDLDHGEHSLTGVPGTRRGSAAASTES